MFATLDLVERRWISMGEHRVNVRVWRNLDPTAPTAVLMHGAIVSSLYMLPLANELSRDYNVYMPELPGQGASPRSHEKLDTRARGNILSAFFERLDLHNVTLVSSSYGSQVSSEMLLEDPSRVESWALIGPTVDDSEARPLAQITRLLAGLPHEAWWFTPLGIFDLFRFGIHRSFPMARELANHDMADRAAKIDLPATIVRGSRDLLCTESWAHRLGELLGARVVTVPNAGHTTQTRAPQAVADEVRKLTARVRDSAELPATGTFGGQ